MPVQPRHPEDHVEACGEKAIERLRDAARVLEGARVLHVSPTAYGGGVAELLHTHVPDSVPGCWEAIAEVLGSPETRRRVAAAGLERVRRRFLTAGEVEDQLRAKAKPA